MPGQDLGFYETDSTATLSIVGHDIDVVKRTVILGPDEDTPLLTHTIVHPFDPENLTNRLVFEARTQLTRAAMRAANFIIRPSYKKL